MRVTLLSTPGVVFSVCVVYGVDLPRDDDLLCDAAGECTGRRPAKEPDCM